MKKGYSVLIIDDHPIISNSFVKACVCYSEENINYKFDTTVVIDCDSAISKIKQAVKGKGIDIIFLDIKLPPSSDGKFLSGEDLGIWINKVLPKSKIIVSTTYNDNYRINNIIKNVNPDGFIVKNDLTPEELEVTIKAILQDDVHYSSSVMNTVRKQISNQYILDKKDRQLLYELSIGTKMIELAKILLLTKRAVYKRKDELKVIFDVEDDRSLVLIAKDKGFI